MVYLSYLLCLALVAPSFGLAAVIVALKLVAAGPKKGWSLIIDFLAFFGAGIAEPLIHGWRVLSLLAVIGLFLTAGAIPQLRTIAFQALGYMGAMCIGFCLFAAMWEESGDLFSAFVFLIPSIGGIVACAWFAAKFG